MRVLIIEGSRRITLSPRWSKLHRTGARIRQHQLREDCMRPRNNRPYRLPARFASFEFIFPVEFKFSSNMRGAQLESLLFNYACCPISPPGARKASASCRGVAIHVSACHAVSPERHSTSIYLKQRASRSIGREVLLNALPSSGVPTDCSLPVGVMIRNCTSPNHTGKSKNTNIYTMVYSHSMALVLPSRHSSCTQFSAPQRNACRRMTRRRISSASGTKAGTTPKTFLNSGL